MPEKRTTSHSIEVPVSYTHLDVYKRQAVYPAKENNLPFDIVIQTISTESPTVEAERPTLEDVYKRQALHIAIRNRLEGFLSQN